LERTVFSQAYISPSLFLTRSLPGTLWDVIKPPDKRGREQAEGQITLIYSHIPSSELCTKTAGVSLGLRHLSQDLRASHGINEPWHRCATEDLHIGRKTLETSCYSRGSLRRGHKYFFAMRHRDGILCAYTIPNQHESLSQEESLQRQTVWIEINECASVFTSTGPAHESVGHPSVTGVVPGPNTERCDGWTPRQLLNIYMLPDASLTDRLHPRKSQVWSMWHDKQEALGKKLIFFYPHLTLFL
jgi:hypothetical protein